MNSAVFLDRDGTLIHEANYCSRPDQVRVFDGVAEALRCLKSAGYRLIVISNQSGIGRGYFNEEDYQAVHAEMIRQLGLDLIDAEYHCPATPDQADPRRKPNPGMLLEAASEWNIDLGRSFMIGDKDIDVQAGHRAGARSILVRTGYGAEMQIEADFTAETLREAAGWILREVQAV